MVYLYEYPIIFPRPTARNWCSNSAKLLFLSIHIHTSCKIKQYACAYAGFRICSTVQVYKARMSPDLKDVCICSLTNCAFNPGLSGIVSFGSYPFAHHHTSFSPIYLVSFDYARLHVTQLHPTLIACIYTNQWGSCHVIGHRYINQSAQDIRLLTEEAHLLRCQHAPLNSHNREEI